MDELEVNIKSLQVHAFKIILIYNTVTYYERMETGGKKLF